MYLLLLGLGIWVGIPVFSQEPFEISVANKLYQSSTNEEFAKRISDYVGNNFTFSFNSESNQSGDRMLAFGRNGQIILGAGEHYKSVEIAYDTESAQGVIPFRLSRDKGESLAHHGVETRPQECAHCHTQDFTYIFTQYNEWPDFLGEKDDQLLHGKKYDELRAKPGFAPFFKGRPKPFPFWDQEENRRLNSMPNTRMVSLMVSRTAKNLHRKIRSRYPDRWTRLKPALLYALQCNDFKHEHSQKIWGYLQRELQAFLPAQEKKWRAIHDAHEKRISEMTSGDGQIVLDGKENAMVILQLLGVPPYSLILTRPWEEVDPLESPKAYQEFMSQYDGSLSKSFYGITGLSPLDFASGSGDLGSHLLNDIDRADGVKTKGAILSTEGSLKSFFAGVSPALIEFEKSFYVDYDRPSCEKRYEATVASFEKKWGKTEDPKPRKSKFNTGRSILIEFDDAEEVPPKKSH